MPDSQAALQALVAHQDCVRCAETPRVAWMGGVDPPERRVDDYGLRCDCWPNEPVMGKPVNRVERRLGRMVKNQVDEQEGDIEALPVLASETLPVLASGVGEPMAIEEFKRRQDLVKYVVSEMIEQVHYGQIPGTSDKSLWEPGAEYLRYAFGIRWDYEVLDRTEDFDTHLYRYRIRAFAKAGDGSVGASWVASAHSHERRFWCKRECPKPCPQDHPPKAMDPGDLQNNVFDRALKRAFVNLIRNVTGTSGYFKQALDDANGEAAKRPDRDRRPQPRAAAPQKPAPPPGEPTPDWAGGPPEKSSEEQPPISEGAPPGANPAPHVFKDVGDFMAAAWKELKLYPSGVLGLLGLEDKAEIEAMGFGAAWDRLVEAKGAQGEIQP